MVFSPDLLDLVDGSLPLEAALKYDFDEDPDKLVAKFINALETLHTSHIFRLQAHKDIPSLTEEQQAYNSATTCEKCGREFTSQEPKVRHHHHTRGKYIGPWCRRCNLLEGRRHFQTIVIFHNFHGYDSHFIIRYGLKYIQDKIKKDAEISSDKHIANLNDVLNRFLSHISYYFSKTGNCKIKIFQNFKTSNHFYYHFYKLKSRFELFV
jgi:hypothetical protein